MNIIEAIKTAKVQKTLVVSSRGFSYLASHGKVYVKPGTKIHPLYLLNLLGKIDEIHLLSTGWRVYLTKEKKEIQVKKRKALRLRRKAKRLGSKYGQ